MNSPGITRLDQGSVRGFLHEPETPAQATLVLTHGAGSNSDAPLLVALAEAFCIRGLRVLRCDLPFRQRKRYGPPFPAMAEADRAGLKDAVELMRARGRGPVFLGGHSYGGRQASILLGDQPHLVDALLLLSYPLHPPGKPDQLRTAHFSKLQVPVLLVHGTRDPFGSIEEMHAAIELIPAPRKLIVVEGASHDLARGKFDLQRFVIDAFQSLMS